MYQYFTNSNFGKQLVVSSEKYNGDITSELSKYRRLIDKYFFFGDIDEEKIKRRSYKRLY